MKRPNFYAPGVDTERLQEEWMLKLEARLDIPCPGCPGCATGDCPDALDVAAAQIAALAQANVRLEHVVGHEKDTRRNAEKIADEMVKAVAKKSGFLWSLRHVFCSSRDNSISPVHPNCAACEEIVRNLMDWEKP